ncbi:MAG: hypothetical protein ACFFA0_01075 [Promethearchaeota archaeon]
MALAQGKRRAKKERKAIYFDIICGLISSLLSLGGLIYVAVLNQIVSIGWFTAGVTFWVSYMIFSFFLIGVGVYTWHKEKNFDKYAPRQDLKAPIA